MKLKIKDLNTELLNLYFQDSAWREGDLELHGTFVSFDKETGEEKGADEILTPMIYAAYISEYAEDQVEELGDNLCNAALFIQEEEEYEHEVSVGEVVYKHSDFISKEQRETNTKYYMNAIKTCNNFSKLRTIRESVLAGQKGKNGTYFFLAGEAKKFWELYHAKKAQLNSIVKIKKTMRAA
jgi:hypothetical protein